MLSNGTGRPRRKRLSWESRCEVVAKVVELGMSPEQAAVCSGVHRSTVYRLTGRARPTRDLAPEL
jgi:transposase